MKFPFKKDKSTANVRRRSAQQNHAPIYSYHAYRSAEQGANDRMVLRSAITARNASRAIHYSLRRGGALAVLLVLIFSGISILMVSSDAKVQLLNTQQGVFLHSAAVYQQATQRFLSNSLTNRTKVTINTVAISESLKHEFPELSAVSIKLPLIGHRPIVYLTSAQSAILLSSSNVGYYVLDNNGRVLGTTREARNTLHSPIITNQGADSVAIGQLALPTNTVLFVQEVVFQLGQKHIGVANFSLPPSTSELDLYPSNAHYFVKFNLAESSTARQQVGTYLATKHYLEEQGITPQYLDVRVIGRAYYK